MPALDAYVGRLVTLLVGHQEHPTRVSHARLLEADAARLVVEEKGRRVSYPLLSVRAITPE